MGNGWWLHEQNRIRLGNGLVGLAQLSFGSFQQTTRLSLWW